MCAVIEWTVPLCDSPFVARRSRARRRSAVLACRHTARTLRALMPRPRHRRTDVVRDDVRRRAGTRRTWIRLPRLAQISTVDHRRGPTSSRRSSGSAPRRRIVERHDSGGMDTDRDHVLAPPARSSSPTGASEPADFDTRISDAATAMSRRTKRSKSPARRGDFGSSRADSASASEDDVAGLAAGAEELEGLVEDVGLASASERRSFT